jgi:Cu-Zn family superoxide dismutase
MKTKRLMKTTGLARLTALIAVPLGVTSVIAVSNLEMNTASPEGSAQVASSSRPRLATASLLAADGTTVGTVSFRARSGRVEVEAKLRLTAGMTALDAFHGFHVHANNKPENGVGCLADPTQPPATWFVSADGHFAEAGQTHGQHSGDLPSVLVNDDGTATIQFTSTRLHVADLDGRAVVLHAGRDNFANVPTGTAPEGYTANSPAAGDKTAATGNAGDRIACGVLKVVR